MSKTRSFLFVCISLLYLALPRTVKAVNAGGEIVYQWVTDSTYRVFFKYYRDCGPGAVPSLQTLCVTNNCNPSLNFNTNLSLYSGSISNGNVNGTFVNNACPGYPTKCQNTTSSIPGFEEWWYSTLVTLPGRCNSWRFAVLLTSRNTSTNITSGDLYIEATLNNQSFQGNSSPYFSVQPVPFMCINQPNTYNHGTIDPNFDSLVTEAINPMSANTCSSSPSNITFNTASPSYSIPTNPFQTGNSFSVNPATGHMSFTPTLAGAATLATRVKEYRGGQLVGTVMRDVQVNILNCSNPVPTMNISGVVGGAVIGGLVYGCQEQVISFCFDIKSSNTSAVLICSDNHVASMPTSTLTYTNQREDSVRGCFNWYPSSADTGYRILVITSRDSSCNGPGIMNYYTHSIPIYIWPPVRAFKDTSICIGASATISVNNGANYTWSVQPGGSGIGSLSCTSCTSPVATPTLTTTYKAVSNFTSYCPNNFGYVTISILNQPSFTPLKDTVICPHTSIQMDLKPTPPTGETYTYKWAPSTYLNKDTIPNPVSTQPKDITYIVTITTNNGCKAYDTISIDELDGFDILPKDTAVCNEQDVQIRGTGDSRYTYSWTTTSTSAAIVPSNVLLPLIKATNVGKDTYTLKASFPGCADSIASMTIDVQPSPFLFMDLDRKLCKGDSLVLKNVITPVGYPFNYSWTPPTLVSDPTILNPKFYGKNTGSFTIKLNVSTSAGCSDSGDVTIKVALPTESLDLLTGDTAICGGDSIQLHVAKNAISAVRWTPPFDIDDTTSFDPFVSPHGGTIYTVYSLDSNACADTQSVQITVKPSGFVYLPDSVNIYPGDSYQLEPGGNCLYYTWTPSLWLNRANIANPVTTPEKSIRYVVNGMTEFGCAAADTIDVIINQDSYIELPNAFSPQMKFNFKFSLIYKGKITLKRFSIYNRWGGKIFETANPDEGWDGKLNGEIQPMGVYIYIVEATLKNGAVVMKKGNVTLIR